MSVDSGMLRKIADGYFATYKRKPKKSYTTSDVLFARDYLAMLVANGAVNEIKAYLTQLAIVYGIDPKEATEYIRNHPEYIHYITDTSNLEETPWYSYIFKEVIQKPIGSLGDAIGGGLGDFLKKVLPPLIIIAIVIFGAIYFTAKAKKGGK